MPTKPSFVTHHGPPTIHGSKGQTLSSVICDWPRLISGSRQILSDYVVTTTSLYKLDRTLFSDPDRLNILCNQHPLFEQSFQRQTRDLWLRKVLLMDLVWFINCPDMDIAFVLCHDYDIYGYF